MKIAVHSKVFHQDRFPYIKAVLDEILHRKCHLSVSKEFAFYLQEYGVDVAYDSIYYNTADLADFDFAISIGGDGTLLETVTAVRDTGIPVLGINTGRLGFLATLSRDSIIEGMEALFSGEYIIEERTLLEIDTQSAIFGGVNFALNDFTVTKRDTASMIIVHAYLNGEYLNSYWADGLIVSTPTGSTAYSLSVGGPIIAPHCQVFIIAPISPHNLNVRPLVVSDDSEISLEIEGRSNNFLISLDSRSVIVDASIRLHIRKAAFKTKLVRFKGESYFKTLRIKVSWGFDSRNWPSEGFL